MGCLPSKTLQVSLETADEERSQKCISSQGSPRQFMSDCVPLQPKTAVIELEVLRLLATRESKANGTAKEARFHTITQLLQTIFKVPIAVVGLIETDSLYFYGGTGTDVKRAQRVHSVCDASLRVTKPTMMVVEDSLQDSRFQHGQFVSGPPYVRFYAGAPLISSEGYVMGSLGMMDVVPRQFPADMYNMVCNFAELVVRDLEREKAQELQQLQAAELSRKQQSMVRALACFNEAIILCDVTSQGEWRILYANDAWESLTGITFDHSCTALFSDMVQEQVVGQQKWEDIHASIAQRKPFSLRATLKHGLRSEVTLNFRPATNDHLGKNVPLIGIPNFVWLDDQSDSGAAHYFATAQEGSQVSGNASSSTGSHLWPHTTTTGGRSSSSSAFSMVLHSRFGLDLPDTLAELELGPLLGKGSYGRVYRGKWRGARVAVKVLDSWTEPLGDAEDIPRKGPFMEALLSKQLPHPHIVQTYEFAFKVEESAQVEHESNHLLEDGISNDGERGSETNSAKQHQRMWIIQQYCNRGTLYDATDRGWLRTARALDGPTDMLALLRTAEEIASALSYLHSRNIIHGDLTGNNVLLSSCTKDVRRFAAQVGDFGLARVLSGDAPVATACMGTVTHMPPEALVEGTLAKATAVYSFGVLLWEMYCHRRAWAGHMPSQVVYLVGSLKRQLTLPPDAPPAYKALTEDCLAFDWTRRPSSDSVLSSITSMLKEVKQAGQAEADC